MLDCQVLGQPLQQRFSVLRPGLSALLELDDAASDFPIGGRQDSVDGPCLRAPGIFQ